MSHPAPPYAVGWMQRPVSVSGRSLLPAVYPSSLQRSLLSLLDSAADRIEGLALFLYRHGD
ncbi:MAG: hypothetical protein DME48_10830 [Verrucomicrobia bacterium]|nr:MAG: hypothetical protein DME48_10830 [Verrucomicrobiota bacterium]